MATIRLQAVALAAVLSLSVRAHALGAATVRQGDYAVSMTENGLVVSFRGTKLTCGTRLTISRPGYTGTLYPTSATSAAREAVVATEKRLTFTDAIPEMDGDLSLVADVDRTGVTITLTVRVRKSVEPSPLEFSAAMFDPERFAGGAYRASELLGEGEWARLPAERPQVTGPGTFLIHGDVMNIALRGKGLEVQATALSPARPSLFDMRSRDYPPAEKVYWLLYQAGLTQGEATFVTRLSARPYSERPANARARRRVFLMDGKRRTRVTSICVEGTAHAVEKAAARELQQYLARMGAGQVPILDPGETAPPKKGVVYVGRSQAARSARLFEPRELDSLAHDAYLLRARGGNVLAVGGGYRGTTYAVYRLLEELGCRFYANELEVVPTRGTVTLRGDLDLKDGPAFEWRAMWGTVSPMKASLSPGEWAADVGDVPVPKMMGTPRGGFWHHTMGFLLPADKVPTEYLAMIGGERRVREPAVQQYCLSNPGLLQRMTEVALAWMDEVPELDYYPIHYGDVGNFCECDGCKALYAEKGSVTDAVIWFLNQIAAKAKEKHPGKFLTILAYWGTRKPPVKERPLDNLLIIFCAIAECQARPWSHPINLKLNVCADLERWIALHPLGPKGIITFEYPCTYHFVGYPYPALYAFAENLRYYKRLGLRGVYICGLTRGHLVHLYSYVMPRLLWNPDRDLGKLVDEFTQAWYGQAWKPMRAYVELLHRSAMESRSEGVMDCHAGPGQRFFRELMTREFLDKAEGLMAQAQALAPSDVVRRRIETEKWGLLFTDLFLHAGGGRDLVPDDSARGFRTTLPTEGDFVRMAEFLNLTRLFGRPWEFEPRRQYSLSSIVGFEPTASPWWTCPRIKQIMDDPREAHRREAESAGGIGDQQLVVLENPHTQVQLIPSLGGRIWRLRSKAHGEDLFRRNPVPRHLLASGAQPSAYVDFGGYEEYVGERHGSPGWAEKYDCTVSEDRQGATLTARLASGLEVRRTVRLLADRCGVEVDSQVVNTSREVIRDVVLRAHPEFRVPEGARDPVLSIRRGDGGWDSRAPTSETWLSGEGLPAGAWSIGDRALNMALVNEFEPGSVGRCFLYVAPNWGFLNLELFSEKRDLAPGESLRMTHRYYLREGIPG